MMARMGRAAATMTADELYRMGDIGRCELIRGALVMMSPAGANHGWVANRIAFRVTEYVQTHGLGAVYAAETGFIIERDPDTVRAPDVAFVTEDRLRRAPRRGYFPGPPDLAVEVVSPEDTRREVREKALGWIAAGCAVVWVADPDQSSVTVFSRGEPERVCTGDDLLSAEPVLPGLCLIVRDLFPSAP
jgi:Uma2 family endonuclease